MDLFGLEDMLADRRHHRIEQPGCLTNPVAQCRAVEFEPLAGIDLALAVQRQMIPNFDTSRCASVAGVARPRGVGIAGAGAWVIASHAVQAYFGRTCRITWKWPGT